MKKFSVAGWVGFVALVLAAYAVFSNRSGRIKIGFVNTQHLITSFKPAYQIEKELNEEDDQFKARVKLLDDSLKMFMDSLAGRFEKADAAKKKELQDQLAYKNQEINNISRNHARRMDEERGKKMQGIYDKINAYMTEFGKKEGYSIIFGTVQGGNILYGDGTSVDITQKVIDGLNARYQ